MRPDELDCILIPRTLLPGVEEREIMEVTVTRKRGESNETRERAISLINRLR